jgi:hypothetical protein
MTELEGYVFIIDTEQYAGNFEREMCAYCTGILGDCEVGEDALVGPTMATASTPRSRASTTPISRWLSSSTRSRPKR